MVCEGEEKLGKILFEGLLFSAFRKPTYAKLSSLIKRHVSHILTKPLICMYKAAAGLRKGGEIIQMSRRIEV